MTENATAAEIRRLEDERGRALVAEDWATIDRLVSDDVVHIHANGSVEGKATLIASLQSKLDFLTVERPDLQVRVYGDFAIATGPLTQKVRVKGPGTEMTMRLFVTQTWLKTNGSWQQNSFQATPLPPQ